MGAGELPTAGGGRARSRTQWVLGKVLGSPRADAQAEQVAAVCYRVRGTSIEFLLVRTRKGRWTFPKGGAEAGLTYAQAAALEAFEEAGVHGRIEEVSFARYRRGKRDGMKGEETVVLAFLCEVLRLVTPQEMNRSRTWFSAEKAKSELGKSRSDENGADIARVVDRALARIVRLRGRSGAAVDGLQTVKFEARRGSRAGGKEDSAAIEFAVNAYVREAIGLRPVPLLTNGKVKHSGRIQQVVDANAGRKVVEINSSSVFGRRQKH